MSFFETSENSTVEKPLFVFLLLLRFLDSGDLILTVDAKLVLSLAEPAPTVGEKLAEPE
jgi:hypothetical protein